MGAMRYHYCSLGTFEKIVCSQKMRLSDLGSMNDPNEISFLWDSYTQVLPKESCVSPGSANFTYRQQMDDVVYLSFCVTEDGDSPFMWERYASGGTGVAMGFDEDALKAWASDIRGCLTTDYRPISYYDSAQIRSVAHDRIETSKKTFDDCGGKFFNSMPGFFEVFSDAPFMKKSAFRPEREHRLLIKIQADAGEWGVFPCSFSYCPHDDKEKTEGIEMDWGRNAYSVLYPMLSIPFEKDMMEVVRLGPKCEWCVERAESLLKYHGYTVKKIEKA